MKKSQMIRKIHNDYLADYSGENVLGPLEFIEYVLDKSEEFGMICPPFLKTKFSDLKYAWEPEE